MPPKNKTITKSANKTEVIEKVREIKQRQQNWLRQRDDAIKSQAQNQDRSEIEMPSKCASKLPSKPPDGSKTVTMETTTVVTTGKHRGFRAWMHNKETTAPKRELGKSYVVSDQEASACSRSVDKPLSPEQFDDVADRIANRVKNELHISSSYNSNKYSDQSQPSAAVTSGVNHSGNYDDGEEEEERSLRLNSHVCPQCSQLMVEEHEPMLIIPCGHNVCRACSRDDDLCPVCSCEIQSVTCNIMLKQVISNFKRETRRVRSSRSNSAATGSYREDTDYSEELKSLMMRLEILEGECDNISDVMRVIQQDIRSEEQQINRIEEEESRVKKEMENLTKKLESLNKHKEEYRDNIESLEDRHSREADKLHMVKETIRELNRGVEKIQLRCGKS